MRHPAFSIIPILLLLSVPPLTAADDRSLHEQIDSILAADWKKNSVTPSARCSDAEFVRRVFLDLNGVIPNAKEARAFFDATKADKRVGLVDHLLARPEYALQMARVFDVILNERRLPAVKSYDVAPAAWRTYLAESFAQNKPWNKLVQELLASDGSDELQPAAIKFYVARDAEPHQLTRDVGRLFLGVDLQCAQCHDDPRFDDYKQADYYGIYAFLSRLSFFRDTKLNRSFVGERAMGDVTFTSVFTTKQGRTDPRLPGHSMIADPAIEKGKEYVVVPSTTSRGIPHYSRRMQLADKMPHADTPGFVRNLGNRLWAVLMGRGIVHPLDLHHAGNPASHPDLLQCIEQWLVEHHYDIKGCLRELALSRCYQLSSELPPGAKAPSEDDFAVAPLRGLTPEQLRWSLMQVTGRIEAHFTRADTQLKKSKPEEYEARRKDWHWSKDNYDQLERQTLPVITTFAGLPGQDDGKFEPIVDHALFLLNSPKLFDLINAAPGTAFDHWATLGEPALLAEEIYLGVFSRRPTSDEIADVAKTVASATKPAERVAMLQPLVWGLLLSSEFRLNH